MAAALLAMGAVWRCRRNDLCDEQLAGCLEEYKVELRLMFQPRRGSGPGHAAVVVLSANAHRPVFVEVRGSGARDGAATGSASA